MQDVGEANGDVATEFAFLCKGQRCTDFQGYRTCSAPPGGFMWHTLAPSTVVLPVTTYVVFHFLSRLKYALKAGTSELSLGPK